jgi:hypothetical protein
LSVRVRLSVACSVKLSALVDWSELVSVARRRAKEPALVLATAREVASRLKWWLPLAHLPGTLSPKPPPVRWKLGRPRTE